MKKIILTNLFIFSTVGLILAQSSAVTNAIMLYKERKYAEAKTHIDEAVNHPKTMGKSKTWLYRGHIYKELAGTPEGNFSMYKVAAEAYNKAVEVGDGDEYGSNAKAAKVGLWSASFNAAVKAHQGNDFSQAMELYEVAMQMRPEDTLAYYNGTIAAEQAGKWDKSIEYNNALLKTGNTSPSTYVALINAYKAKKDFDKVLELANAGLEKNPNHKALLNEQINGYIGLNKSEEAIESLKKAIEVNPENDVAMYNLGFLYGKLGEKDSEVEYYKKAIEANSDNEDANYMMGNSLYNEAAEIYNEVSTMGFADYQKYGQKKETLAKAKMKECIPYFEKVHQLNPNDQDTIKSLASAYEKVGDTAKSEEMYNKLK